MVRLIVLPTPSCVRVHVCACTLHLSAYRKRYHTMVGMFKGSNFLYTCTVQITSNLKFTCACSQNPRECASSTCERAYTAREQKYYTRSYIRTRELRVARVREHCERKYYTRTYGPRMRMHAYSHSHARTHTVLALARAHSFCNRECCIDLSRTLAPPSRVKRER